MYDYDAWIALFDSDLDDLKYWAAGIQNYHTAAQYEYGLGNDHEALGEVIGAIYFTWNFAHELINFGFYVTGLWRILDLAAGIRDDIDDLQNGGEYELTLVKMIEAYINGDDDHRSAHRLLLDAYQASMYDKPFDQEYHASWVQRFRSWT